MYVTYFEVKNRQICTTNTIKYTGVFNVDTFKFNFDEEWDDLNKTLVIIVGDKTYNISLLNNTAILPKEAYNPNEKVVIGIFGKNENTLLATELINIVTYENAYHEGSEPENLPAPSQWDLYIAEINKLLNEARVTEEECQKVLEEIKITQEKIEEYDLNHNQKMEEYNENAQAKVNELTTIFNENVENKTIEFNNKAEAKVNDLNTVFNENVNIKTNEFNKNVENKEQELYDSIRNELNNDFKELENQLEYDCEKWGEVLESKKQGVNFMTEYAWGYGYISTSSGTVNNPADTNWANTSFIPTFKGAIFNFTNISTGYSTVAALAYYDKNKKYLPQYATPLVTGNSTYTVPDDDNIVYVRVCLSYRTEANFTSQKVIGGAIVCISTPKENIDNIYKKLNDVDVYASENKKGMIRVWTETVGDITTLYISTEEEGG